MIDFIFGVTPGDIIYDIETYPNVFTFHGIHVKDKTEFSFEISDTVNETFKLVSFLTILQQFNCRMVGFNNYHFDYPVIHYIVKNSQHINAGKIYHKAMSIIKDQENKLNHTIWDKDQIVKQLDLFKIHHFDNRARTTSLKVLEFNMRSDSVEGLPFEVGTVLTEEQILTLKEYNRYDVLQTLKFYEESLDKIRFREELSEKYNKNFLNHNDTKIGKDYFIMQLEKTNPGCCYKQVNGSRKIVQTHREYINLSDVILPYIQFENAEFKRILSFFKSKRITETKGVFTDISCVVNGFKFDFGLGGIHGSVENNIISNTYETVIEDWDVASYYPNLSITNNFYPNHLGDTFCKIYKDVYEQRKQYKKGTAENAMLKLALNGVYGDSNNQYSPFYDPQYTMSITVNGQLLLCMLAEQLFKLPYLQLIQINTDGLTIKYPKRYQEWVHKVMYWWTNLTGLVLESAEYSRMFVRDVNNYLAEYTDKSVKRKGAYEYDLDWHQNHSMLIVPKATEAHLLNGTNISDYIINHKNVFDFMLRTKLPKKYQLEWGGQQVQNVTRYYVSTDGDIFEKVMPPTGPVGTYKRKNGILESDYCRILKEVGSNWDERIHTKNKSVYQERRTGIHTGWTVQICNDIKNHTFDDINYDFYIQEAEKLVKELKHD